jgi:plasmid stabilization system protein ParE
MDSGTYLLRKEGLDTADRIVTELFLGFYKLANLPNSGHRRADLTTKGVLFYHVRFLIIYEPESKPLQILEVLHGKRDVAAIVRQPL